MDFEFVGDVDFRPVSVLGCIKKINRKIVIFLVVITKTKNKYEIDLGKHKNSESKEIFSGYLKENLNQWNLLKKVYRVIY